MLNFLKAIPALIAVQGMAVISALELPIYPKLTVRSIKHFESEIYDCGTDPDCMNHRIPARTVISVYSDHDSGEIGINEETGQVLYIGIGPMELVPEGSHLIAGIPGALLASPLILANFLGWKVLQAMTGMERHAWVIWLRIRDQLDPKTYIITEKAFEKFKGNYYGNANAE